MAVPAVTPVPVPGTVHNCVVRVSASMVLDTDPASLTRYLLDRVEYQLTVSMLTELVSRATTIGVHRRALAPFAREVIDAALRFVPLPDRERIRWAAQAYTHADGNGDD